MFSKKALLTASVLAALILPVQAQDAPKPATPPAAPAQRPPPRPLEVKLIRDNVYWAQGGVGGNSGIIVGKDGVTVIDAKQTPDTAKEMIAKVAAITDKPIKTIILTGFGGEGIPGLAGFPKGLTIITHETTAKELAEMTKAGKRGAPPAGYEPTRILKGEKNLLTLNGVRMVFLHIAASHTDAESSVYLPDQRVVFTGFVTQASPDFPIIHYDEGGSAVGWVKFQKALLDLDADTYVLGAGDIWTRQQMQARLDAQVDTLKKIRDMQAAGKSREDMRQAFDSYHVMGGRGPQIYFFSEAAWEETLKGLNK